MEWEVRPQGRQPRAFFPEPLKGWATHQTFNVQNWLGIQLWWYGGPVWGSSGMFQGNAVTALGSKRGQAPQWPEDPSPAVMLLCFALFCVSRHPSFEPSNPKGLLLLSPPGNSIWLATTGPKPLNHKAPFFHAGFREAHMGLAVFHNASLHTEGLFHVAWWDVMPQRWLTLSKGAWVSPLPFSK